MDRTEALGLVHQIMTQEKFSTVVAPTVAIIQLLDEFTILVQQTYARGWNDALNQVTANMLQGEPVSFPRDLQSQVEWMRGQRIG